LWPYKAILTCHFRFQILRVFVTLILCESELLISWDTPVVCFHVQWYIIIVRPQQVLLKFLDEIWLKKLTVVNKEICNLINTFVLFIVHVFMPVILYNLVWCWYSVSQDCVVIIVTWWRTGWVTNRGFDFWEGQGSLFCPESIYTTSGADDSPPSSALIKNVWNYISSSPYAFCACTGTALPLPL
jgi:hypothetical protein